MGQQELANRMRFEAHIRAMEDAWEQAIMAGHQPTMSDIFDYFSEIRHLPDANYAEFATRRIDQAINSVINIHRRINGVGP